MPDKPKCKLVGEDGNVFSIIGLVRKALKESGQMDRAREFVARSFNAKSYDEVLNMAGDYVEIF